MRSARENIQDSKKNVIGIIVLLDPVTEWRPVLNEAIQKNYGLVGIQLSPISETMGAFHPSEKILTEAGAITLLDRQDRDVFACVQALKLFIANRDEDIKAIIPLSETAIDFADVLSALIGLTNHNPLEQVLCKRDKGFMKESVANAGLRIAKFERLFSAQELEELQKQKNLDFPTVIKTPQGFSTTDVFICSNFNEAHKAVTKILSSKGPDGRTPSCALLEEYISGTEFAVNLLVNSEKELVVTDVWMYEKTSTAVYNSARLCSPNDPSLIEICNYAKRVAKAVGICYGAAHVELKATQSTTGIFKDPVMMEVGARLSGGRKATMTQLAYQNSFDPFGALIDSHLGVLNLQDLTDPTLYVEHMFLPVEQSGHIKKIHSVLYEDISKLSTLHSHFMLVKEGEKVKKTSDITSSAGFVWLVGDKKAVEDDSKTIRSSFWIEMEDE